MKIDISEEQEQQLRRGKAVEVFVAADQQPFVLLAHDQYERIRDLLYEPVELDESEIAPAMRRAQEAFWRELPELLRLKSRRRQWAAYHGDERVCVTKHDWEAYQECFRRGFKRGEFFVGFIELDPDGIPPWGTIEVERSFFEYTDDDDFDTCDVDTR